MTPSMFPNMDDSPKVNSIAKKSTAHAGAPGMCRMASVKTMNARPVPEALCKTRTAALGHTCTGRPSLTHTLTLLMLGHMHQHGLRCETCALTPSWPRVRCWACSIGAVPGQHRAPLSERNLLFFSSLQPACAVGPGPLGSGTIRPLP